MVYEHRVYTVNRGMMDQYLNYFTETLVPIQEKHGIKIEGKWVNEDRNQFIWIRSFANPDVVNVMQGTPEWDAVVPKARSYIARIDVQTISPA